MFKKGGIFLGVLLCMTSALAQDKIAEMFRHDNPNLMNLNEPKEYTGEALVHIEGVKAPEKANNEMEALQLEVFGTKDIQKVTKNTLELSSDLPQAPVNQLETFTFQNPFHQPIEAVFVHHIPSFMVVVQVLDQNTIRVSENVTVMNTDKDLVWSRQIPLPVAARATITEYSQNDQHFNVKLPAQKGALSFTAPQPMLLGPNQISLTYQIEKPFDGNQLNLEITGLDLAWPIEQFKTLFLFPTAQTLQEGKLTFGANRLEIPNIYRQQTDANSPSTYFHIQRVVPPKASIQANLKLDLSQIPEAQTISWKTIILYLGVFLVLLYWLAFAWWTKHFAKKLAVSKIRRPKNILLFSTQTGRSVTEDAWQELLDFSSVVNEPVSAIISQHERWKKHPHWEELKAGLKNFILSTTEVIIGTALLVAGIIGAIFYSEQNVSMPLVWGLSSSAFVGCVLLYFIVLKKIQQDIWQRRLAQLSVNSVLAGLTLQQIKQIYPLFVLVGQNDSWRKKLNQVNPVSIHKAHLQ